MPCIEFLKEGAYGRAPVQQVSLDALLHNLGLEVAVTDKETNQGLFHPGTFCFSFTAVSSIKRAHSAALGPCAHVLFFLFFNRWKTKEREKTHMFMCRHVS